MTREHKLALVIGFGLILFVGILLSDHLRHESPQNEPLPSASNTLWSMPKSLEPKKPVQLAAPTQYASTVELTSPTIPDHTPLSTFPILRSEPTPTTAANILSWKPSESDAPEQTQIRIREETPKPTPVLHSPRTVAKQSTHTVKNGETLQEISHTYFGTTRRWKEISDLNNITNGNMVRAGQTLVLPAESGIRTAQKTVHTSPSAKVYTVEKGDTLSKISKKTLGTTKRWREIQDLNSLKDSNSIKIGAVLTIPQR